MLRRDGSIQSANLPTKDSLYQNKVGVDHAIYRCMITKVYFVDDPLNITFDNKQVTYDATIIGGRREGQILNNIRTISSLGGQYNYEERVFRKATAPFSGPTKVSLSKQTGDIVYVGFLVGDMSLPIIIGCGTHPLDKTTTGATIAEGSRSIKEYNGVNESINKDGEWELVRKGGTYNSTSQYFVPADRSLEELGGIPSIEQFQARLKFSKNLMIWEDPHSSMAFDKLALTWTHVVNKDISAYKETIDGIAQKTTRSYAAGLTITEDAIADKVTIATRGGLTIVVNGLTNDAKISTATGDSIELSSGTVKIKELGGGELKLSGGTVALGGSTAEVVDILSQTLEALSITLGNLGYLLSESTTFATLKTQLDTIKGSL